MTITTKFCLKEPVCILETSCRATVLAVYIGDNGVQYSLRWFSQGQTYSGYFFEEELGPWQPPLSLAGFNANPTQTKDEVICHAK